MFGAIWAFLNSPLGTTLITSLIGFIFASSIKDKARRQLIQQYADTAWHLAEMLPIPGVEKYKRFIETIVNALKASGQPELSGTEMNALQQLASVKSMLAKPRTPPPLPLP